MLHEQVVPQHTLELLRKLAPALAGDGFYLAGGTALALRLGHRVSIDLDFFHPDEFDPEKLMEKLAELTGQAPVILQLTAGSVSMTLRETKVEILEYRYPLLASLEKCDGVCLCSFKDNAAMKLSALVAPGAKKEFIDIAAILQTVSLDQLLDWFAAKFPNTEPFMAIKSLTWLEDAEKEPDPVFLKGQSWDGVKAAIIDAVK